jgi:hypothetical protein
MIVTYVGRLSVINLEELFLATLTGHGWKILGFFIKIRGQRSMVPYYLFSVMAVFFTLMVLFGSFFSLEYRIKIFLQTGAEFKG